MQREDAAEAGVRLSLSWRTLLSRSNRERGWSARKWDAQYRTGHWDRLGDISELAHLSILAGYFRRMLPARSSMLDVGCGEGLLLPQITGHVGRYLGVDVTAGVELARARRGALPAGIEFRIGDMDDFAPDECFDAITFCESIYYLHDCRASVARYLRALLPGGLLLVSCHAQRKHERVWAVLDELCNSVDAVQVRNAEGTAWNVRVLRPREMHT